MFYFVVFSLLLITICNASEMPYSISTRNANNALEGAAPLIPRKCCPADYYVFEQNDGSYTCLLESDEEKFNYNSEFDYPVAFPSCDFKVLKNNKYKWFRQNSRDIEVGLIYLQYPVWLPVIGEYCIDSFKESNEIGEEIGRANILNGKVLRQSFKNSSMRNKLIAFCDLDGIDDFHRKVVYTLVILFTSAMLTIGTTIIYIFARKCHKSREWLQFSIFVFESCFHLAYAGNVILRTYYFLWTDSLTSYIYYYYFSIYCVIAKFTLGIAASIDLLLCVWKPHSSLDETNRSKRNYIAMAFSFMLPLLIPIGTNLHQHYYCISKSVYMNSNVRLYDGIPKSYRPIIKWTLLSQFGMNVMFACITAFLIHRQRSRFNTSDEKKAQKEVKQSFVLYMKLICTSEIPFFITASLNFALSGESALHIMWNLTRALYLISAIYVFIYFGCSKKHRYYISKTYNRSTTSGTNV